MGDQKRKKDYPCLKCNQHVKRNDPAVLCNMCELWVHKDCAKIEDALFDHLVKQQKHEGRVYWACVACNKFASKFYSGLRKIEERVSTVEATLVDHQSAIDAVNEKVKVLEQKCIKANDDIAKVESGVQENASESVFNEMRERETRCCNVIIHGLKEPDLTINDKDTRITEDMQIIQNLCNEIEVVLQAEDDVKFARRLGVKPSNEDDPRPLLMSLKSSDVRNKVLSNAKKLANKSAEWKKVSIAADLTKRQREEEKNMREDAKNRNAKRTTNEEKNWEWKVVGRRGDRRLVKVKLQVDTRGRILRSQANAV